MMTRFVVTAMASALMAACAMAQSAGEAKKSCCMDDKSGKTACAKTCSAEAAAALPAMKFKVGDETVCCPTKAKELAKGDEKAIKFVVADKTFTDKGEALEAYAKALETFVADATTVKYAVGDQCVACPVTAGEMARKENKKVQFRLASFNFDNEDAARKAVTAAKEAAEKVEMKMMVGDKAYTCPVQAGEAAKKDSKQVEYVIGETKTCCDKTAKAELAKARALAALAAIEKAASPKA